jgi:hypothetical protein
VGVPKIQHGFHRWKASVFARAPESSDVAASLLAFLPISTFVHKQR